MTADAPLLCILSYTFIAGQDWRLTCFCCYSPVFLIIFPYRFHETVHIPGGRDMTNEGSGRDTGNGDMISRFPDTVPSNRKDYRKLYRDSLEHREEYWRAQAMKLVWDEPFATVVEEDFTAPSIAWFREGSLNAFRNVFEGGGKVNPEATALVYYAAADRVSYTFSELRDAAEQAAAALKASGFAAGDRIALYLPDCPETVILMLACSLNGVTYVPVPCTFNAEVTAEIVEDCGAGMLFVDTRSNDDSYLDRLHSLTTLLDGVTVVSACRGTVDGAVPFDDFLSRGEGRKAGPASVSAEHPLCLIYANSAAGIPRGSIYATGGFLVQAAASFESVFQPGGRDNTAVLSTVSLSSAAGQSYGLWGPLLAGYAAVFTDEGDEVKTETLQSVLGDNPLPILLTTPRLLTALKRTGVEDALRGAGGFSLIAVSGDILTPRLVTYAGEHLAAGKDRVVNLWIQSESGAAVISTFPVPDLNRPGALGLPFFGVKAAAMNNFGQPCRTNESGQLVFPLSWPGMIRGIWGQPERFRELYFQRVPGYFMTNDGVRIDGDGFVWFMGRLDDVVKIRGNSLATSEIEAVLVTHQSVSEAAVVSVQGMEGDDLVAFVATGGKPSDTHDEETARTLRPELSELIVKRIGEFALPSRFVFSSELPRTRTGKLVRRVLRRIASGDIGGDEDMSHVANPGSVEELIRKKDADR